MFNALGNWLKRRSTEAKSHSAWSSADAALAVQQARAAMRDRPALNQTILVQELADPAIAAHLFRRKLGQEIPQFPRHFAAMAGADCAGYVHFSAWQGDYLCGGLCIDDRAHQRFSPLQRAWLHEHGGIAEILLRAAHSALTDGAAIWCYVTDHQAEAVYRRAGFIKVAEPYLLALWKTPISEQGKVRRIAAAAKLGAF